MTSNTDRTVPDPSVAAAATWLKTIKRDTLHGEGWIAVNRRFHGLALAARPFVNQHYKTTAEQEAAFDGITLALMAIAHFEDIDALTKLFAETPDATSGE